MPAAPAPLAFRVIVPKLILPVVVVKLISPPLPFAGTVEILLFKFTAPPVVATLRSPPLVLITPPRVIAPLAVLRLISPPLVLIVLSEIGPFRSVPIPGKAEVFPLVMVMPLTPVGMADAIVMFPVPVLVMVPVDLVPPPPLLSRAAIIRISPFWEETVPPPRFTSLVACKVIVPVPVV